jgi:hypothetical protein
MRKILDLVHQAGRYELPVEIKVALCESDIRRLVPFIREAQRDGTLDVVALSLLLQLSVAYGASTEPERIGDASLVSMFRKGAA